MIDVTLFDERGRYLALRERMSAEEGSYPAGGIAVPPLADVEVIPMDEPVEIEQTSTKIEPLSSSQRLDQVSPVVDQPGKLELE